MRQLGQEAAQKAKDGMKKSTRVAETFSGKGKAEPVEQKSLDKSAAIPPPISVESSIEMLTIETPNLLQSPTSSAWKNDAHAKPPTAQHEFDHTESLQSPNSTTWKSIREHGGPPKPVAAVEEAEDGEEDEASSEEDEDEDEEQEEEEEDKEEEEDDEEDSSEG
jgi:hypothetical protein